jgi:transposase-like protein
VRIADTTISFITWAGAATAPAPTQPTTAPTDALRPAPDPRLQGLISTLGVEDGARAYVEELRWPDGVSCPRCESDRVGWIQTRKRHECRSCRYQFRFSSGTIFHDSHLSLSRWLLAVQLILESETGFPANQLHAIIGGSYKTSWFVGHRIRSAMSCSFVGLGMPQALTVAVDQAILSERPTDPSPDHAEHEDAVADGWLAAKRLIAGAYHRPSPEHLPAYRNEARWRTENIGNENAFRETIRALLMTEPLPWHRLVPRTRSVSAIAADSE